MDILKNDTVAPQDYLKMDPMELLETMKKDMVFVIPEHVHTPANKKIASETISKATAFATYFTEMETRAKLLKKAAKASGNTAEYNRYLNVEDVFKSLKEIAKMQIENVAKIMTLKRLELDEQRSNYNSHIT